MRHPHRFPRTAIVAALVAIALLAACGRAQAGMLDDGAALGSALTALRGAIGDHPRVLRIEIDAVGVTVEAQDPRNRNHVDRWRYGSVRLLGLVPVTRLSGPDPVDLRQLVNPELEANLFDLGAVDLAATPRLVQDAIARAKLQDPAAVTGIEIARQVFILPSPSSGDVRWTVHVSSGRERAEIHANAQGAIVRADLGGTQRARTLNILREPAIVPDAAAEFRRVVGAKPVLTSVGVEDDNVRFQTNINDPSLKRLGFGVTAAATYYWDLSGLHQRALGNIDTDAMMGNPGPAPFGVDDVDWTILARLRDDALAKAAVPRASVREIAVANASDQPGGPVLLWTVTIIDPNGEVTSVIADTKGAIRRVVLPESRRPKPKWLDAATIADALARIAPTFGADARIASIVFADRGARVTLDDPSQGGRAATFDFAPDALTRASFGFGLESMGPRFAVGDIAWLDEQKIAALEAEAMQRLAGGRTAYLESFTIGAHPFVRRAGAHAIEVRVRDIPVDSAQANYAWIVFDFNGRVLESSAF
jgi:hypothetical protein